MVLDHICQCCYQILLNKTGIKDGLNLCKYIDFGPIGDRLQGDPQLLLPNLVTSFTPLSVLSLHSYYWIPYWCLNWIALARSIVLTATTPRDTPIFFATVAGSYSCYPEAIPFIPSRYTVFAEQLHQLNKQTRKSSAKPKLECEAIKWNWLVDWGQTEVLFSMSHTTWKNISSLTSLWKVISWLSGHRPLQRQLGDN